MLESLLCVALLGGNAKKCLTGLIEKAEYVAVVNSRFLEKRKSGIKNGTKSMYIVL